MKVLGRVWCRSARLGLIEMESRIIRFDWRIVDEYSEGKQTLDVVCDQANAVANCRRVIRNVFYEELR